VPAELDTRIAVGSYVRVSLHGRRIGAWVLADGVEPPAGVRVQPIDRFSTIGPSAELVELSEWAAWRWAGRRSAYLRTASPPRAVRALPPRRAPGPPVTAPTSGDEGRVARDALAAGQAVVRMAPASDTFALIVAALARGPALIIAPAAAQAQSLARRLGRAGVAVAGVPDGWAEAAAGGRTVVGARGAAWAPCPDAASVIVLDAHDEALVEERAPTWSAWVVAAERARRRGLPCLIVSPCPTLEQLGWGSLVLPSRAAERGGWPPVRVLDRRDDDPRTGLFSEALVPVLRRASEEEPVVCVLNREGRARLLRCATCREVAGCERCGAAVEQTPDRALACRNCGLERPTVCLACGGTRLKVIRAGVTRVAEELSALAGRAVVSVTAESGPLSPAPLLVGTEAVLRRVGSAATVAFLDFDAEILAPRYRAGEQALVLLARAARVVARRPGGMVLVQTRRPDHPAIQAAVRADPGRLAEAELVVRKALQLPPASALAQLSGEGAASYAASLQGVAVGGPDQGGRWLVRARDHAVLCDALAAAVRPTGRLRIEVDPLRI
jgi:primosomal protein N' (replication factor Y)